MQAEKTKRNEKLPKIRSLKITDANRNGLFVFNGFTHVPTVPIPHIKLSGKWLSALGFDCGKRVTVKTSDKQLIISVDPD